MIRLEQIQTQFAGISGSLNMYVDATQFFYVDVDENRLEGYRTVTASCGCCSEQVDVDTDLSYEIEYMDDADFNELIEQLDKLK
jgi:hypothetical protein